jgi:bile acid:Na+ symporter, BASS family
MDLDLVRLNFNPAGLKLLKGCIALIMFGIALDLKGRDFRLLLEKPRAAIVGVLCHLVLLPALTLGLIHILNPHPGLALGMVLVAACPGGNMSNFLTMLARGNVPLSVSLTAFSDLASVFFTPFNFIFWGSLYAPTAARLKAIEISIGEVAVSLTVMLVIPLIAGMLFGKFLPGWAAKLKKPFNWLSVGLLALFIVLALAANFKQFLSHIGILFGLVLAMNSAALLVGYNTALLAGLAERERRTIAIETGIQNSGLGLMLVFTFFDGNGPMAMICAWWGIWHLISGASVALLFRRRPTGETISTQAS